jgi:hypothetical protein
VLEHIPYITRECLYKVFSPMIYIFLYECSIIIELKDLCTLIVISQSNLNMSEIRSDEISHQSQ